MQSPFGFWSKFFNSREEQKTRGMRFWKVLNRANQLKLSAFSSINAQLKFRDSHHVSRTLEVIFTLDVAMPRMITASVISTYLHIIHLIYVFSNPLIKFFDVKSTLWTGGNIRKGWMSSALYKPERF